jgi:hypothetical protein
MINFIDTNIFVGYCFQAHRWHEYCKILDKINNIWSSKKVLDEWNNIEDRILDDHTSLIYRQIDQIKRKLPDMIEVDHREKLMKNVPLEIQSFLGRIYRDDIDFPLTKEDLCNQLEAKILQMQYEKTTRFLKLDSTCKKHTRTKDYGFENDKLEPCVHNGDRDRGIILDAHDLVLCNSCQKMIFLTLDNELSGECKEKIMKYLKIAEIKDIRYY